MVLLVRVLTTVFMSGFRLGIDHVFHAKISEISSEIISYIAYHAGVIGTVAIPAVLNQ